MRKIILDLAVSLDGFIEGPHGEVDWCIMEDDMDFNGFLSNIDTIFYSRVSYEMWGNYKPDTNATETEKVAEIKRQEGQHIWLYGGSKLITTFIKLVLIDNYRISVHPTVLGSGKPLFKHLNHRLNLKLIQTNKFKSGVVQLIYEPEK